MSPIRTRPATPEYREGWDRVFGQKRAELRHLIELGRRLFLAGQPPDSEPSWYTEHDGVVDVWGLNNETPLLTMNAEDFHSIRREMASP